ncbi:MAG: Dna2/Cas4 domain-containing protein [Nanoarchaeota archaeon]|nr:Dna2/Cas4 domain-containing protein [Nanoarchaeota archaeon]
MKNHSSRKMSHITGTFIKNYMHCKRQAWLYYYGINFQNEITRIGKLKHIEAGSEELVFDEIKIDKIKENEVIEFKKTSSNLEGTKMQLLYYLYKLKQNGIEKIGRLRDLTYGDEHTLILDNENLNKIESLIKEMEEFIRIAGTIPNKKQKRKECKGCSFFDYCWS